MRAWHPADQQPVVGVQGPACPEVVGDHFGSDLRSRRSGRGNPDRAPPGAEADTRRADDRRLSATMATQGPNGRAGLDGHSRAPRDGLCRTGWTATHHRPLHLYPLPRRVCRTRAISHPCARTRLVTGSDDRRHDPPPGGCERKPCPRRGTGINAGHPGGCHDDPGRCGKVGLRRRPALQADPDRLHDRVSRSRFWWANCQSCLGSPFTRTL